MMFSTIPTISHVVAVDKSGNPVLTDIGVYIKEQLEHRLKQLKIPTTIKYIGELK